MNYYFFYIRDREFMASGRNSTLIHTKTSSNVLAKSDYLYIHFPIFDTQRRLSFYVGEFPLTGNLQ